MNKEKNTKTLEKARKAKKAIWEQIGTEARGGWGYCSSCGTKVVSGNFCNHCGATFLIKRRN